MYTLERVCWHSTLYSRMFITLCKGVRPSALEMLGSIPLSSICLTERDGEEERIKRGRERGEEQVLHVVLVLCYS